MRDNEILLQSKGYPILFTGTTITRTSKLTNFQNFGLLPRGIGGGSSVDVKVFFFGGGGGGGFFPSPPDVDWVGDARAGGGGEAGDLYLAMLSATPYFWSRAFAEFQPVTACSPCRSRKLFAVDAVPLISASETFDGSFRKLSAVFRAACFWAQVVPAFEV
jgi:hypothetical protein